MDTIENKVNPQAKYYGANRFFKQYQHTADGGGTEGTYTKNFKLDVQIADEMLSIYQNTICLVQLFAMTM